MLARCPRCDIFQMRCDDDGCEQCSGDAMDLSFAISTYLPALIAIHLLHQLPLKTDKAEAVRTKCFGKVLPMDVDFDTFTTHTGMTVTLSFVTLYFQPSKMKLQFFDFQPSKLKLCL